MKKTKSKRTYLWCRMQM